MNLPNGKRSPVGGQQQQNAGAVELGGFIKAAPANCQVGAVGFGPSWDEEPSLREMYDAACRAIVRVECEADELRAEVALLQSQARIIIEERDEARIQYRSTHSLAEALVKTIGELKAERVELKATINTYRDDACRESCRDKAAADGGWGNI